MTTSSVESCNSQLLITSRQRVRQEFWKLTLEHCYVLEMARSDPPTLGVHLAARIRGLREERGWRQEDLARIAREKAGLSWRRVTVVGIETGRREVTVAELLLLPLIFWIPVADLFPESSSLRLGPGVTARGEALRRILTDPPPESPPRGFRLPSRKDLAKKETATHQRRRVAVNYRRLFPGVTDEQIPEIERAALGTAEQKAAAKFGCHSLELSAIAFSLWGRSLTAERDRRVEDRNATADATIEPRSQQARRGHVTRTLLTELKPVVKKHHRLDIGQQALEFDSDE